MSSVPAIYRANPWYRVLRCLVVLLVAALERRIARMIAEMEALPEDSRFDAVFARMDARCAYLEAVRDRYLAWLEDPTVELPRLYDARAVAHALGLRRVRPRLAGAWVVGSRGLPKAVLEPPEERCRCALG